MVFKFFQVLENMDNFFQQLSKTCGRPAEHTHK